MRTNVLLLSTTLLIAQQQPACDLSSDSRLPRSMNIPGWGEVPRPEGGSTVVGKLREADRQVLAQADPGWVNYVTNNLDVIVYYDVQAFAVNGNTQLIGLSNYSDGVRVAAIAARGKTDVQMGRILAHEAGHMELSESRRARDERYALQVEEKYAAALENVRKARVTHAMPRWWPWR